VNLDVLWAACRNPAEKAAVTREAQRRFAFIKWERDGGVQRALAALQTMVARAERPETLVGRVKFALEKHGPLAKADLETILNEPILPNTIHQLHQQGELESAKELRTDARGHRREVNIWRLAATVCTVLLLCGCVRPSNPATQSSFTPPIPARVAPKSITPFLQQSSAAAAAAAPVATNRPVNVTLAWDASPDASVTGYRVYFGIAPEQYTNSVTVGTATTVTISNLVPRTRYYFAATAFDATGVESDFSNEANWPLPLTNFVTVAVTRRSTLHAPRTTLWSQTLTNPPGDQAFFETTISLTNNDVSVVRLDSSTLLIANTNQP
jgi:hypothetical protein